MGKGVPELPYWVCAATQLAAVALVFTLPAAAWRNDAEGEAEGEGEAEAEAEGDADAEGAAGAGD